MWKITLQPMIFKDIGNSYHYCQYFLLNEAFDPSTESAESISTCLFIHILP